jgi:hypothetical protein
LDMSVHEKLEHAFDRCLKIITRAKNIFSP